MSDPTASSLYTLQQLTSLTLHDTKFIKHISRLYLMLNPTARSPLVLINQLQPHYAPRYVNPHLSKLSSQSLDSIPQPVINSLTTLFDVHLNVCPHTTNQVSLGPYILSLSTNGFLLFATYSKLTKSLTFTHLNAIQVLLFRHACQRTLLLTQPSSDNNLTTPESLFSLLNDILLIMSPLLHRYALLLPKCILHSPLTMSSPHINDITTRLMVSYTLPQYALTFVQSRLPPWIHKSININNHQRHGFTQSCLHSFLHPTIGHSYGYSSFHGRIDTTISQRQWTNIQLQRTNESDSTLTTLITQYHRLTTSDAPYDSLQYNMSRLPLEIYNRILTTYLASLLSSAHQSFEETFSHFRRSQFHRIIIFITLLNDNPLYPDSSDDAIHVNITCIYPHAYNITQSDHRLPTRMSSYFPHDPLILTGPTMPLEILLPSSQSAVLPTHLKEIESCPRARSH